MKNIKILFVFLLFIFHFSLSFGQSWLWGEQGKVSLKANDFASPVATDKYGNAYITGQYSNTIIFGNDTLNNATDDAYLTKYDPSGNVIWTTQIINSYGQGFGTSVATDKAGNIYITGFFSGNAWAGPYSLLGNNYNLPDVFLVKYNSNGTILWAKQSESAVGYSYGYALSVATDKLGNVFITGYFIDSISFGGITLRTMYAGNTSNDVFLTKYDSNGNVLWARQSEVPTAASTGGAGNSVATDNSGNAYITGYFEHTLSFGGISLNSLFAHSSTFLVKYSYSGNVLWAQQSANISNTSSGTSNSVITDQSDNPYITGYFSSTLGFGSHSLRSSTTSIFLTKYDINGNPIWAKQSTSGWEGTGLASDANKHIYMAGISYGASSDTLKFGNYVFSNYSLAGPLSFIMKFDTAGNPTCGSILNYLGSGALNGVASDSNGTYVYTASVFAYTVVCGPDTLVPQGGGNNTFVARWQNCAEDAGVNELRTKSEELIVYPNPSNGRFTMQSSVASGKSSVEIYNMLGEKVYSANYSLSTPHYSLDLSSNPNGVYLYRVISETGQLIGDGKMVIAK